MADDKKTQGTSADIAAALERLAEGQSKLAEAVVALVATKDKPAGRPPKAAPPKTRKSDHPDHAGEKTYIIGTGGHYRDNRLYKAGERITLHNEKPSKDWTLVDPKTPAAPAVAPSPAAGRLSDTNVGG